MISPLRLVWAFGLVIGFSCSLFAAEPVRIFYDVGPTTFEVNHFKDGMPALDTPLEGEVERFRSEGQWSFSGELPVDSQYMSNVYPYRLRKISEIYSNRGKPASYYVHLHRDYRASLEWKIKGRGDYLTVFGWLVGDELKAIMVSTRNAFEGFKAHLKMDGDGILPEGRLVAWLIDDSGRLVPVDRKNEEEDALLRVAAMNGDVKTLVELADGNAKKLNGKDQAGRTLLIHAALGGRTEVAKYLIDQGAKAFEEDNARLNALEIAAEGGWMEFVQAIATKKPKSSDQRVQYSVATVNAITARHQEIALHLLEMGSKVDVDNKSAPEKVRALYARGCVKLARWMQEKYKVKGSYSKDGSNFMHAAASYADTELLELLKAEGASLTETTSKGVTPLLIACGLGNREAICWLMENGGRASETGGLDPVLYAVRKGVNESVSCLIDYGVNVNREEREGLTPLMFACSVGKKEIAETLLDAGGLWLFESKYSDYFLGQLIRLNSARLVEGLFQQGLSKDHKLYGALRLIDVAEFYKANGVVEFLSSRSPGIESKLIKAKDLAAQPKIVQRTNIEYPFELQERHGDIDALVTVGIADGGLVGAVEVDSGVPQEIRDLIERSLMNWSFKPLDSGDEESLAVVAFKLPLRMSMREEDIFEMNDVDDKPRALYQTPPKYPFQLKQAGRAGFVVLQWVIDAEGVVRFPKAIKSSAKEFELPAIESIKQSRWSPGKKNGVPVAVRVRQRMEFNPN